MMGQGFFLRRVEGELFERIRGKSYREDCPIPREDLRYLHVLHRDLRGETREGELVCSAYIARDLLEIFFRLYEAGYPMESIRLVEEYGADDEASMEANNSSCFNYRCISHTKTISKHGLGLAVDINPLYNPYIKQVDGKQTVEPVTAEPYLDRSGNFPYKIHEQDVCCQLFSIYGFLWGGHWVDRKDYQHFEVPDPVVSMLYPEFS